jgi:hypothetical protein|tara:strand:- start:9718 stop:9870 length:153 start_codon:yes stop_codon:yes gene_type:complete
MFASHQAERSVEFTELAATLQHGIGVWKVWLDNSWADAPAMAEAATIRVE